MTTPSPHRVVVHVSGEVDTLTAPDLEAELERQFDGQVANLVLDLTGVNFLASSGLAVLIKAAHMAEERGMALSLVTANRAVTRPLEVTRTAEMFTIHDSLVAAETALDGSEH